VGVGEQNEPGHSGRHTATVSSSGHRGRVRVRAAAMTTANGTANGTASTPIGCTMATGANEGSGVHHRREAGERDSGQPARRLEQRSPALAAVQPRGSHAIPGICPLGDHGDHGAVLKGGGERERHRRQHRPRRSGV
jgi:hypothetical protein